MLITTAWPAERAGSKIENNVKRADFPEKSTRSKEMFHFRRWGMEEQHLGVPSTELG